MKFTVYYLFNIFVSMTTAKDVDCIGTYELVENLQLN